MKTCRFLHVLPVFVATFVAMPGSCAKKFDSAQAAQRLIEVMAPAPRDGVTWKTKTPRCARQPYWMPGYTTNALDPKQMLLQSRVPK